MVYHHRSSYRHLPFFTLVGYGASLLKEAKRVKLAQVNFTDDIGTVDNNFLEAQLPGPALLIIEKLNSIPVV